MTVSNQGEAVEAGWAAAIARWLVDAYRGAIPAEVLHAAARQTLDSVACGLAGTSHEAAAVAMTVARGGGAREECSLLNASDKGGLGAAILYNCTAVRALDCNDVYFDHQPLGHPSDTLPAPLAVAELTRASGAAYLGSVALGYELDWRLQSYLRQARDGTWPWDYTSTSPLVAAATSGLLMNMGEASLGNTLAIAATRSAAVGQIRSGSLSMLKACAGALGAQAGVEAARLAEAGLTGPAEALEGQRGLLACMGVPASDDLLGLLLAPIDAWHILEVGVKPYPAIGTSQGAIEATLALVAAEALDADDVQSVEVRLPDTPTIREHSQDASRNAPQTREAADHSLPFIVAACIEDREFGMKQFADRRWQRPSTTSLMTRVSQVPDARLNAHSRLGSPAVVSCTLKDGRTVCREVLAVRGTPTNPMTDQELGDKLDRLCGTSLSRERKHRLGHDLLALAQAADVSHIGGLLRGDGHR